MDAFVQGGAFAAARLLQWSDPKGRRFLLAHWHTHDIRDVVPRTGDHKKPSTEPPCGKLGGDSRPPVTSPVLHPRRRARRVVLVKYGGERRRKIERGWDELRSAPRAVSGRYADELRCWGRCRTGDGLRPIPTQGGAGLGHSSDWTVSDSSHPLTVGFPTTWTVVEGGCSTSGSHKRHRFHPGAAAAPTRAPGPHQ